MNKNRMSMDGVSTIRVSKDKISNNVINKNGLIMNRMRKYGSSEELPSKYLYFNL